MFEKLNNKRIKQGIKHLRIPEFTGNRYPESQKNKRKEIKIRNANIENGMLMTSII